MESSLTSFGTTVIPFQFVYLNTLFVFLGKDAKQTSAATSGSEVSSVQSVNDRGESSCTRP